MKAVFYDMKCKVLRELTISGKEAFKTPVGERYRIVAKTKDGRRLTKFCNKQFYDSLKVN